MPAKYFFVAHKLNKTIIKLPLMVRQRVDIAMDTIQQNPLSGEKLGGTLAAYRKFRVGDYRIVYRFDSRTSTVYVVKIEHRQGVYK